MKCWMSQNSTQTLQKHFGSVSTNAKPAARHMGVLSDRAEETTEEHLKDQVFSLDLTILVFTSSRLDYCNSMYSRLSQKKTKQKNPKQNKHDLKP